MEGISRRSFLTGATATGAAAALSVAGLSSAFADEAAEEEAAEEEASEEETVEEEAEETGAAASDASDSSWQQELNVDIASVLPGNTSETIEVQETKSCDVVVVGAGCSGTLTATRASELGLTVILVEKSATIGGCSLDSWAACGYNSSIALEAGDETDTDPIISEWIADSHWRVNGAAVRQLVNTAGKAVDWLIDLGWEFTYLGYSGMNVMPDTSLRPDLYQTMLDTYVTGNGGEVLTNTTAKQLVTDDSGAVTGVLAVDGDGNGIEIDAQAVVIATGGYAANTEMVKTVFGFDGVFAGWPYNVGEGLEMAWAVGAQKPQNFGGQMLHQTLAQATDNLAASFEDFQAKFPMILCYVANVLNVDANGQRFRDESLTLDSVPSANSSAYQGDFHYVVVSQSIMDTLEASGLAGLGVDYTPGLPPAYTPDYELDTPWENITEVFDAMVENGDGYKGETAEELAEAAGMDVDTFVSQVEAYNEYCATGEDTQFGKDAAYLNELGDGPYYAIISMENNLQSWGGLLVNTDYQVLDKSRLPISGLYAVGCEAGSNLYNDTYVGFGYGMANGITSGYICGQVLADTLGA